MKNEPESDSKPTLSFSVIHPSRRENTSRLVSILGAIYLLAIAFGVGVLVWRGGSGWLLIAAVPLMFFAPKPRQ